MNHDCNTTWENNMVQIVYKNNTMLWRKILHFYSTQKRKQNVNINQLFTLKSRFDIATEYPGPPALSVSSFLHILKASKRFRQKNWIFRKGSLLLLVVKWLACLLSTLPIRVWLLLEITVFYSVKILTYYIVNITTTQLLILLFHSLIDSN